MPMPMPMPMRVKASPLFADFERFPPLLMQTGGAEMLRDEAVRAAREAHAAGVDVELELWPGTPHVFQVASFLPGSAQAIEHITGFVCARTGWRRLAAAPDPVASRRNVGARRRNNVVPVALEDGRRR